jgi:hypothetical protein
VCGWLGYGWADKSVMGLGANDDILIKHLVNEYGSIESNGMITLLDSRSSVYLECVDFSGIVPAHDNLDFPAGHIVQN